MTESFLQYLWKFRKLNRELTTKNGEEVVILHPGEHNPNSGPDFLNARIRIGSTLWAGNVEIHIHEADWFRHDHQHDHAYDNVILHVVYHENPKEMSTGDPVMPVMVIRDQFPSEILHRYEDLIKSQAWIPCEKLISGLDPFHFRGWAQALLLEKLEEKCTEWKSLLEANGNDWAETLHQAVASVFGLRVNCIPFEMLAKAFPLKLASKYRMDLTVLEALAFGQAGLLNREFTESYPNRLKQEYLHLAAKHQLHPIDFSLWKFLRLRPASFPTLRIAQWASVLQNADRFFALVTENEAADRIRDLFSATASGYWDSHFIFGKLSPSVKKTIGIPTVNLHILNAVAPFLFFYGKFKGLEEPRERALRWIENLPAEENQVISRWKGLGFPAENALQTQALLRLKSRYCDQKRCLECRVGVKVMS